MTRNLFVPGTIVKIQLQDRLFAYGRLLEFPFVAFYDFRTIGYKSTLAEIVKKPVMFILAVHKSVLTNWEIVGNFPLEDHLLRPIRRFSQSLADFRKCTIYDNQGNSRNSTPEECVGLERDSVWEDQALVERLLDFFFERPNRWVETTKVRLS